MLTHRGLTRSNELWQISSQLKFIFFSATILAMLASESIRAEHLFAFDLAVEVNCGESDGVRVIGAVGPSVDIKPRFVTLDAGPIGGARLTINFSQLTLSPSDDGRLYIDVSYEGQKARFGYIRRAEVHCDSSSRERFPTLINDTDIYFADDESVRLSYLLQKKCTKYGPYHGIPFSANWYREGVATIQIFGDRIDSPIEIPVTIKLGARSFFGCKLIEKSKTVVKFLRQVPTR